MLRGKEARGSSVSSWKRVWLRSAVCTSVTLPQRFTLRALNVALEPLVLHGCGVLRLVRVSL